MEVAILFAVVIGPNFTDRLRHTRETVQDDG